MYFFFFKQKTAYELRNSDWSSDVCSSDLNYASYTALAAAIDTGVVAPGRWATCVAAGLVGLGAPPVYPIGVNAIFGTNRIGAMMRRILELHRVVSPANIDTAAFAAMDAACPYDTAYWTKEQDRKSTRLNSSH